MANRYWVGTGTWNTSSTTNWSASSGGAGGASVPGVADTAYFDANSGACTLGSDVTVGAVDQTGYTNALTGTGYTIKLALYGSVWIGATTCTNVNVSCDMYTAQSGRAITAGNVSESNSVNFKVSAGTNTIAVTGSVRDLDFTGFSGTFQNTARTIFGILTISSGMTVSGGANVTLFAATSGPKTITTNGKNLDFPITFSGVGGAWQLQDALTLGSTRTVILTAGSLLLNNKTLTTGLFSSSNINTRVINFGSTGNIVLNGAGGTLWTTNTASGLTTSGTPVVNVSYSGATATSILTGVLSEANSISFNFKMGTYALTFLGTLNHSVKNVDFTGFSGSWAGPGSTGTVIYGNFILSSTMTGLNSANSITFGGTTVSNRNIDFSTFTAMTVPFVFNSSGGTFVFQRDTTLTNYTWTLGNFNLNGFAISTATLVSSGTGTVTANSGRFNVTGSSTTVVNLGSGIKTTDFAPIYLTGTPTTGTRTISALGSVNSGSTFSLYFSGAATDTVTFTPFGASIGHLDTTGFNGSLSLNPGFSLYGNLFFNSSTTISALGTVTLSGNLQQYTIAGTSGITLYSLVLASGTYKLNSNLTLTSSLNSGAGTGGTLNLNGFVLTSLYYYSSGSTTSAITLAGGSLVINGNDSGATTLGLAGVWDITNGNALTFTDTGIVSFTSTGTKTITDGNNFLSTALFPTLNQGGTGTLNIRCVCRCKDVTSTSSSATTISILPAATVTTLSFSLSGTVSAQVTLNSITSGTKATISKSNETVSVSNLTISDITATGGARWQSYVQNGNTNGGNNTGWDFGSALFFQFFC